MSKITNIGYVPQARDVSKPKQGVDIFKKRMEEAFASPDQLKFELQNSSIQNTKGTLIQISLLFFVMILILSGLYTYKIFSQKPVFCSPEVLVNCRACPENSVCENGDFKCNKNYVKDGYYCVEDQATVQKAYEIIHKIENYVIEKATKKYLEDRSGFYATMVELQYLFRDTESVDDKVFEIIRENKAEKIEFRYQDGEQILVPKTPFLGVIAIAQVFWQDNCYYLVVGLIAFLLIVIKLIQAKKERLLRSKATYMYELIRNQLKENVDDTPEHGVPVETLQEVIAGHLGQQTSSLLWPIIEDLRKKDKQVSKFEIHIAGRPQMIWQWKDLRSLKIKPK
ncbi:hypothetical protein SteCoe_2899 [Stentor coeruleus]|uniref:Man1/Src1 C-terminal domain-containing protein n=1 Tax=Stentor coeruleus TaxID=5963 RepID=A0A1R2CYC1_9CILI|nr:hypothetical protein SteCoe_2899 [Stentor coeruleus]